MKSSSNILILLTSHAVLGNTGRSTGVWLEELSAPYYIFQESEAQITLASIEGGEVPIDPESLQAGQNEPSVERFLSDQSAMQQLKHTLPIHDLDFKVFDAIFLPGGHGTVWDFPNNDYLAEGLTQAWQQQKIIAAVCHGLSGLLHVRDVTGLPLVMNKKVTGFTNQEESLVQLETVVPFMLETRLRQLGAKFENSTQPFASHAVRDGALISGQNPASSTQAALLVLSALKELEA